MTFSIVTVTFRIILMCQGRRKYSLYCQKNNSIFYIAVPGQSLRGGVYKRKLDGTAKEGHYLCTIAFD